MKILITAFDRFGETSINPSTEVMKGLPESINGAELIKLKIPTIFYQSAEIMEENILKHKPDAVLMMGVAAGRSEITLERIAINIDDAKFKDNAGQKPIDQVIRTNGPPAYFTNLPIKAMARYICSKGIKASISNSAGTFVCNHIMYQTLYLLQQNRLNGLGGFIHIPYMTEQVQKDSPLPSLPLKEITEGIYYAIEALISYYDEKDLEITGGSLH